MRKVTPPLAFGLACLALSGLHAQEPDPSKSQAKTKAPSRLEEPPPVFVPLHPRTSDEQNRIESLRLFAAARALEDRHQVSQALEVLEKALKLNPDSAAILRRISRLSLVLGRVEDAVAAARKLAEVDPNDSSTISLLVAYYLEQKHDPAGAEAILRKIAADPKLSKTSPGYFVLLKTQGDLYSDLLHRPEDAADAYARLLDALDEKAANALSPREKARVFDGDEASTYSHLGDVFLKAKRPALAVKAFRRGLVYREDHPVLPRLLAEALLRDGKPDQALEVLEAYLKRQPVGGESYELLAEILDSSGRKAEVLPKLEAASQADPANIRLKFVLVDRYREEGKGDKADALLASLLKDRAEPQVYAALAQSYKKAKKADELLKILIEARDRRGGEEAILPTIEALVQDSDLVGAVIDAAAKMIQADPASVPDKGRKLLVQLAKSVRPEDRLAVGRKLVAADRAAAKAAPTADNLEQLAEDLYVNAREYAEAAGVLRDLFAKFPAEKTASKVLMLAYAEFFGGKVEAALETARQVKAMDPSDARGYNFEAYLLMQLGRNDDAIAVYEDMLRRFPDPETAKMAHSGLSSCYVNKGDFARGEAELETIYRDNPDDPGINNDLGYLYADQGKHLDRAEAMIRKALEEQPESGTYLDSLGWVLFKQGKVKEAVEPLEKAAHSEQSDLTICDHLGDVYFRLKDFARARDSWKKAEGFATKTNPPDKRLAEIRKKLSELEKLAPASKPPSPDGP